MSDPAGPASEALLAALPDPALLFDADGRLRAANDAARTVLDLRDEAYSAAQALGTARPADLIAEARASNRRLEMDLTLAGRELRCSAAPVGDQALLVLHDESDRRRVDAVRRDFVANASHELRTPVSGIQALADALLATLDGGDPAAARRMAERIGLEAERLGRLLSELLALRRLEDDGAVTTEPVDLVAVIDEELGALRPRIDEAGLQVERDAPGAAVIAGVEADLRLVVRNLLANAVGYNRPGGRLEVVLAPEAGAWRLVVADSGIGIARRDLDRVFERFYRVDLARSRDVGGSGLGLSIVRHAVERHGGSVEVDSILGEGSTFTVRLPVEPPSG